MSTKETSGAKGSIGDYQKEPIEAWEEQRKKPWQPYVDAEIGFRNHWYPALFSHELNEADVSDEHGEPVEQFKSLTILGERVLFRRLEGEVFAMQDWCLHRGVPLSTRLECYTKERVTCWYHGFTYDIRDGEVKTILTDPDSPLIGKLKARTYPVEEQKGIIFVFIGDIDPPPLEDDVQPGLLDDSFFVYPEGWSREVKCNWRPAAENGFDPAHAYIHRNSPLVEEFRLATVLGDTGISRKRGMEIIDNDKGPRGIKLLRGAGTPVWEAEVDDGVTVSARFKPGDEGVDMGMVPEVSMWMPAGLWVEPAWQPEWSHIEWYVPIDENTHRYMITWGRTVESPEQEEEFVKAIKGFWAEAIPTQFNNEDVMAREAMAEFYSTEDGWYRERLFAPDVVITEWRKLASKRNRGIQHRKMA